MSELRLEFPQLDKLVEMVSALQKHVDEIAKWVQPDSFIQPATTPVQSPATTIQAATMPGPVTTPPPVAAPTTGPIMAVPTSAPSYTLEQVSKAGADLIGQHPEKMAALMGLLQQFNVPAVQALKPDQLGAFATELRGLGANL